MSKISIILSAVLVFAIIAAAFFWLNRPRKLIIDAALPTGFPQQGFSHESFEELLQTYVADGQVDYARWHQFPASMEQLDNYLAAVSRFSPDNAPNRFSNRSDELAYWIYGYNAYVIRSVLANWPIDSVTDIKAPLEAVKGLGFFHRQRFSFGGHYMSLLAVENNQIRKRYQDPRIHFLLNCASESCPIARPELPVGDALETLLTNSAVDFINDVDNIFVDHKTRTVYVSKIFKWYKSDFAHGLRITGKPSGNGLRAYVAQYASETLADDLARAADYKLQYREYDWSLNASD